MPLSSLGSSRMEDARWRRPGGCRPHSRLASQLRNPMLREPPSFLMRSEQTCLPVALEGVIFAILYGKQTCLYLWTDAIFVFQAICCIYILEKIEPLLARSAETQDPVEDCLPAEGRGHECASHCPISSNQAALSAVSPRNSITGHCMGQAELVPFSEAQRLHIG